MTPMSPDTWLFVLSLIWLAILLVAQASAAQLDHFSAAPRPDASVQRCRSALTGKTGT
jgi:hypothetical protein